jgi:NAD(P)-dependent dehydrogenase (short-subunit alcohol dehydrogenase family)
MYYELADFNIKVCTIEPGYFRSNFLNPSNRIERKQTISDYDMDTAVRRGEGAMATVDNNQPGDPVKGAKVIVDVLTGATGREIPMRLALGTDAYHRIKGKCETTIELLEEWKDITCSTDLK